MNALFSVADWRLGLMIVTGKVPAELARVVQVIDVELSDVIRQAWLPIVTLAPESKYDPEIVTGVPPSRIPFGG